MFHPFLLATDVTSKQQRATAESTEPTAPPTEASTIAMTALRFHQKKCRAPERRTCESALMVGLEKWLQTMWPQKFLQAKKFHVVHISAWRFQRAGFGVQVSACRFRRLGFSGVVSATSNCRLEMARWPLWQQHIVRLGKITVSSLEKSQWPFWKILCPL